MGVGENDLNIVQLLANVSAVLVPVIVWLVKIEKALSRIDATLQAHIANDICRWKDKI